jgi:hypothetical protein
VQPGSIDERPLFRSRELLQLRVAARRMAPAEVPLPGDGPVRVLRDAVLAPLRPGPEPFLLRATISAWCVATLIAPGRLARRLVAARYGRRP